MSDTTTTLEYGLETLAGRVAVAYDKVRREISEARGAAPYWSGKLSDSALSTATAVSALAISRREVLRGSESGVAKSSGASVSSQVDSLSLWTRLIDRGSEWLQKAQNADGGFGDTDRSLSNIATTLLVIAAWNLAGHQEQCAEPLAKAWKYVESQGGWDGLRQRYGKDKTFVVPIMVNCALAGLVSWKEIPTLPFEAAALPQSWYRFAKMPVVSYAIPALVAIGQSQWYHNPPLNPITRWLRSAVRGSTLRVLERMQPESGGYLEATPLTSFVLMNLASIGRVEHPVAKQSIRFLIDSAMPDGSWPIDTNLATWLTSLTMRSYYPSGFNYPHADSPEEQTDWNSAIDWLLSCQHIHRHAFTGAEPGGWGWTHLSGAVPDSDDTPAALLVLSNYARGMHRSKNPLQVSSQERLAKIHTAAQSGCNWLLRLQNNDGGWPTFCKGWGTLPFDRSGSDLTAHSLRALHFWRPLMPGTMRPKIDRAIVAGWKYLEKTQLPDGSWVPLWFGNQDRENEDNPFYGTAKVLLAYGECGEASNSAAARAIAFLKRSQNEDGSWGGGPSIHYPGEPLRDFPISQKGSGTLEETAVVLEGLMTCGGKRMAADPIMRGLVWMCSGIERDYHRTSQPIGFYFAKLWYHEKHYPLVYSLAALRKGLEFCHR